MRAWDVFVGDEVARIAEAGSRSIPSLDNKMREHSMKRCVVVKPVRREKHKAIYELGTLAREKLDQDVTMVGDELR